MNDVIINKIAIIERCLKRVTEVYQEAGSNFDTDYTRQDSVVLNLQRACEAAIVLANIINKLRKTGIPQSSRDSFELLNKANLLPAELSQNLQKIVGLRNVAVHDYQTLNIAIVKHVVEHRLSDFDAFCQNVQSILSE